MTDQISQDNKTLSIACVQLDGFAAPGYYVDVIIRTEEADSVPVRMMIDTGAMVTCIPKGVIDVSGCLRGKPLVVSGHTGTKSKLITYRVDVLLMDAGIPWSVERPFRGVLLRDSEVGLLGLDVLRNYEILLDVNGALMAKRLATGGGK